MKSSLKIIISFMAFGALAEEYPLQMLERPFTMPKNAFESELLFKNSAVGIMSANYGITNDLQLGLSWNGMSTKEVESGKKIVPDMSLSINAAYFTFGTRWAAGMVTASMPLHFESNTFQSVSFAAPLSIPIVRHHLGLFLFYYDSVVFNWKDGFFAEFNLPLRLNWQATERLYLKLGTNLATLSTNGNHNHLIKTSPLTLEGLFAVTKNVDILGSFGFPDVQHAENMVMMLGVAFRGGALDG